MGSLIQVYNSDGKPRLAGGSKFKDHIDWLELNGWTLDASKTLTKALRFTIPASSPITATLFRMAASGSAPDWDKATLDGFSDDSGSWSLRITLTGPVVTSCQTSGNGLPDNSFVQATLGFARISLDYVDPKAGAAFMHGQPAGQRGSERIAIDMSDDPTKPIGW